MPNMVGAILAPEAVVDQVKLEVLVRVWKTVECSLEGAHRVLASFFRKEVMH